ncbi:Nop52-domain-containing protein [Amylocystis lapponica]|nr:Nop52-domain-containing protein [Amylocystis lapponica]
MAAAPTPADTPPLGKYLASTGHKRQGDQNLASFLSDPSRDVLPKSEMMKLWKGFLLLTEDVLGFWMSDKPLVQQALASELAEILLSITTASISLSFLRGFWETTVREWNSIDRLRIDKYYMLVRRFVNASFRLLIREEWDSTTTAEYNTILTARGGPLCPEDIRVPASLSYHLADIYLEELDKALGNTPTRSLPAPLSTILTPFLTLAARTPTADGEDDEGGPRRRKRPRLSTPTYTNLTCNACATDPTSEGALESGKLKKALLRQLFEVASEQDTRDANRRKMYAFWKNHTEEEDEESGERRYAIAIGSSHFFTRFLLRHASKNN